MVLAAVLTPLTVLALFAAAVAFLPTRLAIGVALAAAVGVVVGLVARARAEQPRTLSREEAPELHAIVDRLCALGDIRRPAIELDEERQPNSWIIDAPGRRARLHVTQGLLDALEPAELEAVVAHELAHVANRDATVMTVVGGPGAVLLDGGRRVTESGGWWLLSFGGLGAVAIGTLSRVGTNALSRYREMSADAGAAALTGRPAALASALLKVSGELGRMPTEDLRAAAGRDAFHLLPVEADSVLPWRLGATHPALARRVAALERMEERLQAARPRADL
jgi:heat shock protein HtpX